MALAPPKGGISSNPTKEEAVGMRCTQHRGLYKKARWLLDGCGYPHFTGEYETREVVQAEEGHNGLVEIQAPVLEPCVQAEPSGEHYHGMFPGEEFSLTKYTLRDGTVYYEDVQASPWSSGPVIFLALRDEEGNWVEESLWPEEAIERA